MADDHYAHGQTPTYGIPTAVSGGDLHRRCRMWTRGFFPLAAYRKYRPNICAHTHLPERILALGGISEFELAAILAGVSLAAIHFPLVYQSSYDATTQPRMRL